MFALNTIFVILILICILVGAVLVDINILYSVYCAMIILCLFAVDYIIRKYVDWKIE